MAKSDLNVYCIGFYIATVIYHFFIIYYVNFQLDLSISTHTYVINMDRFSWRFLTAWNFAGLTLYFIICVADNALEMFTGTGEVITVRKKVRRVRNYMFHTIAFPVAFTVSALFWLVFAIDRNLVFPEEVDRVMPLWMNHALHTNIVIFVILEQFLTFHWYPTARKQAITSLTIYNIVYHGCYLVTYINHGVWLYPIHEFLNWTQRFLLIVALNIGACGFYMLGEGMNSKIWENEIQTINEKRKHRTSNKIK